MKSAALEKKMAELQKQLEAARAAEQKKADADLLRLVHRAGIQRDVIAMAERALAARGAAGGAV